MELVLVREATVADYEGLCDLFAELDSFHREALPHLFRKPDGPARTRESISNMIEDQDKLRLVTDSHGQINGFVYALVKRTGALPVQEARRYVLVEDLFVREDMRRDGLG